MRRNKQRLVVYRIKAQILKSVIILLTIFTVTGMSYAQNLKWEKMPLLVCLPPNPNNVTMKEAFTNWQKATKDKVSFVFLTANECPDAQITVSYAANKTNSNTTFAYRNGYLRKAHIEISFLTKDGKKAQKEVLQPIMMHEIGHAIGIISHTNTPKSVMQPTVKAGYYITEDAIRVINNLYK